MDEHLTTKTLDVAVPPTFSSLVPELDIGYFEQNNIKQRLNSNSLFESATNDGWIIFRPESFSGNRKNKDFFLQETTTVNEGVVVNLPSKEKEWLFRKNKDIKSGIVGWITSSNNENEENDVEDILTENKFNKIDKNRQLDSIYLIDNKEISSIIPNTIIKKKAKESKIKIDDDSDLINHKNYSPQILMPIISNKILQNIIPSINQINLKTENNYLIETTTTSTLVSKKAVKEISSLTSIQSNYENNFSFYSQSCNLFYSIFTSKNIHCFTKSPIISVKPTIEQNKTLAINNNGIKFWENNLNSNNLIKTNLSKCCLDKWNILPINPINKLPPNNSMHPIIPTNNQHLKSRLINSEKNHLFETENQNSFFLPIIPISMPTIESIPDFNYLNKLKIDASNNNNYSWIPWYKFIQSTIKPTALKTTSETTKKIKTIKTILDNDNFTASTLIVKSDLFNEKQSKLNFYFNFNLFLNQNFNIKRFYKT